MTTTITLGAERRSGSGKGPARQLRAQGRIPAVIYGHERAPESLSISAQELERALTGIAAESTVFDLTVDGTPVKTLIREIQRHPYRSQIIHVDFYEIRAGQKVALDVPIRLVGAADGVKNAGGVMDQLLRELRIRVLPADIPDHIDVDVTALRVGGSLHVSDLVVPNVEILEDPETTVCTVVAPRLEEEPVIAEVAPEAAAEPELIRKPKEEEGGEEAEEEE